MIYILSAGAIAMTITLLGTRWLIRFLTVKAFGQFVRDDGPKEHHTKRGTPTMGGLIIVVGTLVAYFLTHLIFRWAPSASGLLVLYLFSALGFVGFLDDWTKISKARSLGLNARAKLVLQGLFGASFALLALQFPDARGVTPASPFVSFLRDIPWLPLATIVAVAWIMFMIAAFSNGANLTDGADGLLTGCATMVFGVYVVLNIWQSNQWCGRASSVGPHCYEVRNPTDLAVVAMSLAASCFGFLWWNARPAKIFMGDTGSLAIGGAVAALAIFTRTELLGAIIGGIFVIEALSVLSQVGYFKITKGKRLWKMAPIHHHFEMLGWNEITVVVRFWILCGLAVAVGLGLFYAEWVVFQ